MKSKTLALQVTTVLAFAILIFVSSFMQPEKAVGSAFPGTEARIATSSNPTVSSTAAVVFATSTCAARTITTGPNPIMMTFSDWAAQTPTASFGHFQAASTTVTYDGGQVGCGLLKVYSFGSQTITVSEAR